MVIPNQIVKFKIVWAKKGSEFVHKFRPDFGVTSPLSLCEAFDILSIGVVFVLLQPQAMKPF